jgi:hypothetical protein
MTSQRSTAPGGRGLSGLPNHGSRRIVLPPGVVTSQQEWPNHVKVALGLRAMVAGSIAPSGSETAASWDEVPVLTSPPASWPDASAGPADRRPVAAATTLLTNY